jgi:hypothetical protein
MASRVALQGSQMRNHAEGGTVGAGKEHMLARWCELQEELGDGSYKYDPPSGPVFKLPLEACLFVNVEQDIAYNRKNFVVGATAIANLTEEASKLDYG